MIHSEYRYVQYIKPTYTSIDIHNPEEITKLKNNTILECQGDFVLFDESKSIVESMLVFQAIRPYCDEIVVEVKNTSITLGIYTIGYEDVVRPFKVHFLNVSEVIPATIEIQDISTVDISHLFKEDTYTIDDIEQHVNDFLKTYISSKVVILQGSAPLAFILSLQYVLHGLCAELLYEHTRIF